MTIIENRLSQIALIASLLAVTGTAAQQPDVALSIIPEQETSHTLSGAVQQSKIAFPSVSAAQVPLYPPGASAANIEGVVRLKVTTDGHRVISVSAEKDSHPVLARAAEANARTWEFSIHEPTTFIVTYQYKLVTDIEPVQNNPRVILRLPTEVEVDALRWPGTVDMPTKLKGKSN